MSEAHKIPVKRFSLKRKEIQIELEGADGKVEPYILRELVGAQRDEFINLNLERSKGTDPTTGKPLGPKHVTGTMATLISMSLFNAQNIPVTQPMIQQWPSEMQMDIFRMCQELSGLQDKAEDVAKNGSVVSG